MGQTTQVREILLVEDDSAARAGLRELLELRGFVVHEAADGKQALTFLKACTRLPDALVLDLSMPVMDGEALHAALQQHAEWDAIPILVTTGHRDRAFGLQVDALLPKPFEPKQLLETLERLAPAEQSVPPRVLVVEDEPDLLEVVCELLEMSGYRPLPASNGQEALAQLEREGVDAVLTDLMMPNMDGWELVQRLREHPRHAALPVLVLSAVAPRDLPTFPVEGVLHKPVNRERLLQVLERALRAGAGRRAQG